MKRHLYGMVCATITPYDEAGNPCEADIRSICRYLVENGAHGLYPNGTNGESLSLRSSERRQIAAWFADENRGRAVLAIQCGAATTEDTYALVRHAARLNCDAAGIMTPVFWPLDERAMEDYYTGIVDEVGDFPIYLYNIPSRSGNDVPPTLLARLMENHANIYGIKCSMPDLIRISDYLRCTQRETDVLIGNDTLALSCLALGGKGFVTGPGAVFLKLNVGIYEAFVEGDIKRAQGLQTELIDILRMIRNIPEIPAIKYMLMRMGVIHNDACRRPLRALTGEEKRCLDRAMIAARV